MLSDFVKYVKQYWHDRPDKSTPLNADRLNHIENGIGSNSEAINQIANAVVSNIVNDPDKIASMAAVYTLQEKLGTGDLPSDAPNAISAINTLYSNLTVLNVKEIQFKPSVQPVFTSANDLAAGDEVMFTVTFDKAFSAIPAVTFTLRTNGDNFLSQVSSISTTGFTGYIRNPFSSAKSVRDVSLCYTAMC